MALRKAETMFKIPSVLALISVHVIALSAFAGSDRFQADEMAKYTLADAETEQPLAVVRVHKYFDGRGLSDRPPKDPKHPRLGYVVTVSDPILSGEPEVLWGRRTIGMHLREQPTEIAAVWWDERHSLLWVVLVMSVAEQSVAEVHTLPMVKNEETGEISLSEETAVRRLHRMIKHSRGEADRVSAITIHPEGAQGVVLKLHPQDKTVEPERTTIDRSRMRAFEGIQLEEISGLIRSRKR